MRLRLIVALTLLWLFFVLWEYILIKQVITEHICYIFRDIRGHTPLCCIPWDEVNAFEIMKLLLDAGANPPDHDVQVTKINYKVYYKISVTYILLQDYLQDACSRGCSDNVSLLLKHGAKADSEALKKALTGGYEYVFCPIIITVQYITLNTYTGIL